MPTTKSKFIPLIADKQKFYAPIFSSSSPLNVSLSIQALTEYTGNISIDIAYWDNGEKIIIKDFLAGQSATEIEFTINSPTSVPPFIVYIDSDNPSAVDIGIDYDLPLTIGPITDHDEQILTDDTTKPLLNIKEVHELISPNNTFNPASLKSLFGIAETTRSPLAIDLDGDGVETLGTSSNIHFDHDGNGFAENTGWIGKDDGILVRDLNNNSSNFLAV